MLWWCNGPCKHSPQPQQQQLAPPPQIGLPPAAASRAAASSSLAAATSRAAAAASSPAAAASSVADVRALCVPLVGPLPPVVAGATTATAPHSDSPLSRREIALSTPIIADVLWRRELLLVGQAPLGCCLVFAGSIRKLCARVPWPACAAPAIVCAHQLDAVGCQCMLSL